MAIRDRIHAFFVREAPTISFCAIWLGIATLCSLFNGYSRILELAVHFPLQYVLLALPLAIGAWALGKRKLAIFLGVLCCWHAGTIVHAAMSTAANPAPESISARLTLLQFNARYNNKSPQALHDLQMLSSDYDLVVFAEFPDALLLEEDEALKKAYPYREVGRAGYVFFEGLAVFSKYPIDIQRLKVPDSSDYSGVLRIFIPEKQAVVYAVHSPTPIPLNAAQERDAQQQWLFAHMAEEPYPAIAVGDFNQTPYSENLRKALLGAGLRLAPFPDNLLPTWPRQFVLPILQIPIDLAVANGRMHILSRARVDVSGSDHVAVRDVLGW